MINKEWIDDLFFESKQRLNWYIQGIGIHGLTPDLFSKLTTKRLCEIYNIDKKYFKK